MLIDICVSFDVLLGFDRKMYVVRSDDNKMAMSTVSSYEKIDYNRSLVLTAFPFQFLRRHCHEPDIRQSEIEKNSIEHSIVIYLSTSFHLHIVRF